jgi:CHAT domain-containing protein/tetratricopeptide (TPR) repeat protein
MLQYLLYEEGKQKQALAIANQCLTLARQINYIHREVCAQCAIATSFLDLGQYKEALPHLNHALKLARQQENQERVMSSLERISVAYRQLGNLKEAANANKESMRISEQRNDNKNQIRCLINFGLIDKTGGDYTKAQQNFEKALKIARQQNDPNEAAAEENLGDLYRILGNYDKALIHHSLGLEVNNKSGNYYRIARNKRYIGDVYRDQNDLVHAINYYKQALKIVKNESSGVPPKRLESEIWLSIGDIQKSQQDFQEATKSYQRALATFKSIEVLEGVASAEIRIGNVLRDSGQFEQALAQFKEGLEIAQRIAQPILTWNAFYGMGLVFRDMSDFSSAVNAFSNAIAVVDSTRGKIFTDEEKINYFACHQDLYDDMILLCFDQGNLEAAFNYSECSRCRSFFDLLSGKIELFKNQESFSDSGGHLNIWNPMHGKPYTLKEIQQTLPDDVMAIEYKITEEKLLIFAIDKTNLSIRESIIQKQELQDLVWQYRQAIGAESEEYFKQKVAAAPEDVYNQSVLLANQLYLATIKPIEALLDRDKIIYMIPNDALFYVPFEALIAPDDGMKRFFIEDYTIAYVASASILKYCLDHQKARLEPDQIKLLAIGNPTGDLIGAENEVENIAKMFPNSQKLVGETVTEDTVIKTLQASFDVIHFATHAVAEESNPLYSYLVLGKRGADQKPEPFNRTVREIDSVHDLLMTYEVFNLNLAKTQLITLSACRTACGRMFRGEGIVGMNRAFMKAGASTVISSFWKVEDKYAEIIMTSFYDQWKNKSITKAEALRNARLRLLSDIRNDRVIKYPHPFLWAAFALTGDYH